MWLAAQQQFGALGGGVVDQALHLGDSFVGDQRADLRAALRTMADSQFTHALDEASGKALVNGVMYIEAVDANTGLPGVTVFGDQRAFYRGLDIGVFENDERRIAPKFQRHLLYGLGALAHQQAADWCGTCEAELAYQGMASELRTDGRGIAGNHVDNARRHASALGQLYQGQGREWCFVGRLDHQGAAGGEGRCGFAGDHRGREVPRRDGRAYADALLDHQQALVR
ncbi:hypothetical protein D9M71_446750 [compost metagenome]